MLTQELSATIRQELPLLAMTTADKRKYIVYQWNQTHGEPIDEDAVALFLCDENRETSRTSSGLLRKSAVRSLSTVRKSPSTGSCNAGR